MKFQKEFFSFLLENRKQNNKEWYASHKEDYKKYVYLPLAELVEELAPCAFKIDKNVVTQPRYCISRIYKDTRFSKDKSSLYRDNMWLTFKRPSKNWLMAPAFYFEIMQNGFRYGMGYYTASRETMSLYRDFICKNPNEFRQIIKPIKIMSSETEHYKRKLKYDCPEDLYGWLSMKSIHLTKWEDNIIKLYDDKFINEVVKGFKQSANLYTLLIELSENPQIKEERGLYIPKNDVNFEW